MIHRDSTGGDGDEVCSCRSAIALFLVANFKTLSHLAGLSSPVS